MQFREDSYSSIRPALKLFMVDTLYIVIELSDYSVKLFRIIYTYTYHHRYIHYKAPGPFE